MTGPTLEESREARLREGRRRDLVSRGLTLLGTVLTGAVLIAAMGAVYGRTARLGKGDFAAGNSSNVAFVPWDDAPVVFRQRLTGGPTVEVRLTAVGMGVPPGAEFRVDGLPAGTVFGVPGREFAFPGTRVSREGAHRVVIRLDSGYRPAQETVSAGAWTVAYGFR